MFFYFQVDLFSGARSAAVIYDGRSWVFFVKKRTKDFPLVIETIIHAVKMLFSKAYSNSYNKSKLAIQGLTQKYKDSKKAIDEHIKTCEQVFSERKKIEATESQLKNLKEDQAALKTRFEQDVEALADKLIPEKQTFQQKDSDLQKKEKEVEECNSEIKKLQQTSVGKRTAEQNQKIAKLEKKIKNITQGIDAAIKNLEEITKRIKSEEKKLKEHEEYKQLLEEFNKKQTELADTIKAKESELNTLLSATKEFEDQFANIKESAEGLKDFFGLLTSTEFNASTYKLFIYTVQKVAYLMTHLSEETRSIFGSTDASQNFTWKQDTTALVSEDFEIAKFFDKLSLAGKSSVQTPTKPAKKSRRK